MLAVIFDLDGTLVDLFELHLKAFRDVILEDYGLHFERRDLEVNYGRTADEIAKAFFEKHGISDVDYDSLLRKRRDRVTGNLNSCMLLPGARRLLDGLKRKGVDVALATANTPDTGEAILEACGLAGYFGVKVYRTKELRSKPAPDMFLKAAGDLDVEAGGCVVVEDSVYGIMAANAAGMKSIAVTTGTHSEKELGRQEPDLIVNTLKEVNLSVIRSLFRTSASMP